MDLSEQTTVATAGLNNSGKNSIKVSNNFNQGFAEKRAFSDQAIHQKKEDRSNTFDFRPFSFVW